MSEYFDADGEPTVLGRARARYGSDERGGWPDPLKRRNFDAALAAHDQKVKAAVLREMAEDWMHSDPVSHRFRNWLRDTADYIDPDELARVIEDANDALLAAGQVPATYLYPEAYQEIARRVKAWLVGEES